LGLDPSDTNYMYRCGHPSISRIYSRGIHATLIDTWYNIKVTNQGDIMKKKKICPLSKLTQKEKDEMNARTRARLGPNWETTREEVAKRWGI